MHSYRRKRSKLMEQLQEEQIQQSKNMTPEKRIAEAIAHSRFLRELCFAGLSAKGFSKEEIERIYQGQVDE